MQFVRHYVQELINHAIVADQEFRISWSVFDMQFPELQKEYLRRAELLEKTLAKNIEVDGNRILWLLTKKETTILANAIFRINVYLKKILRGEPVYLLPPDPDPIPEGEEPPREDTIIPKAVISEDKALIKASLVVESSYGKRAGLDDNAVGRWAAIEGGFHFDWTLGSLFNAYDPDSNGVVVRATQEGDVYRFGGIDYTLTKDILFMERRNPELADNDYADTIKRYYIKDGLSFVELDPNCDYRVGDIIAHYGAPVYEQASIYYYDRLDPNNPSSPVRGGAELYPAYIDLTGSDEANNVAIAQLLAGQLQDGVSPKDNPKSILHAKFGHRANASNIVTYEPVDIEFVYESCEQLSGGIFQFKNVLVTNINDIRGSGIALFKYDPYYDWEKDIINSGAITSNLHVRRLVKGWFGHGETGWSRDINSIPYIQTLDEHEWTAAYKTNVKRYITFVRDVDVNDLLHLVNGKEAKAKLLFLIGNLYAVRHELLCIYFRALDAIRKKGLYRV